MSRRNDQEDQWSRHQSGAQKIHDVEAKIAELDSRQRWATNVMASVKEGDTVPEKVRYMEQVGAEARKRVKNRNGRDAGLQDKLIRLTKELGDAERFSGSLDAVDEQNRAFYATFSSLRDKHRGFMGQVQDAMGLSTTGTARWLPAASDLGGRREIDLMGSFSSVFGYYPSDLFRRIVSLTDSPSNAVTSAADQLQKENEERKLQVEGLREERNQLNEEIKKRDVFAEEQKAEHKKQLEVAQQKLGSANNVNETLEKEKTRVEEELAKEREKITNLEEEMSAINEKLKTAMSEVDSARTEAESVKTELQKAKEFAETQEGEMGRLKEENDRLTAEVNSRRTSHGELQDEYNKMNDELQTVKQAVQEKEQARLTLQGYVDRRDERIKELDKEVAEARQNASGQLQSAQAQVADLQQRVQNLGDEVDQLKLIETQLKTESDGYKDQLRAKEQRNEGLVEQGQKLQDQINDLEDQNVELQADIEDAQQNWLSISLRLGNLRQGVITYLLDEGMPSTNLPDANNGIMEVERSLLGDDLMAQLEAIQNETPIASNESYRENFATKWPSAGSKTVLSLMRLLNQGSVQKAELGDLAFVCTNFLQHPQWEHEPQWVWMAIGLFISEAASHAMSTQDGFRMIVLMTMAARLNANLFSLGMPGYFSQLDRDFEDHMLDFGDKTFVSFVMIVRFLKSVGRLDVLIDKAAYSAPRGIPIRRTLIEWASVVKPGGSLLEALADRNLDGLARDFTTFVFREREPDNGHVLTIVWDRASGSWLENIKMCWVDDEDTRTTEFAPDLDFRLDPRDIAAHIMLSDDGPGIRFPPRSLAEKWLQRFADTRYLDALRRSCEERERMWDREDAERQAKEAEEAAALAKSLEDLEAARRTAV